MTSGLRGLPLTEAISLPSTPSTCRRKQPGQRCTRASRALVLMSLLSTAGLVTGDVAAGPKSMAPSALRATELLNDPGFARWFSGVIRVEQRGTVRLLAARGVDGAGRSLTEDSIFWLGSTSKMLTSAVILQLAEQGRLSLEDPVGKHLPGWQATDLTKDSATCTIVLLLSHQCGLPTNVPIQDYARLNDPIRRQQARDPFLSYARSAPLSFAPGKGYQYSNVGYLLAGLIILNHEKGSFDEIMQRRLFKPLGLRRTGFEPGRIDNFSESVAPLSVTLGSWGVSTSRWLGVAETSPAWTGSAGGGFSTPREWTKLVIALFSGQLLNDTSRAQLMTPRSHSNGSSGEANYALGVGVLKRDGRTELGHGGALDPHGFASYVTYIPQWDLSVVVMSSRSMTVYGAKAVNKALVGLMTAKAYKTPFPKGPQAWLDANQIGLPHLLVVPLVLLSMLITAFRTARKGRAALAVGLAVRAWVVLFVRGLLGIHAGDQHVVGLSAMLIVFMAVVLWFRARRQPEMPRWPPRRAYFGRARTWSLMLLCVALMLFFALVVGLFSAATLLLLIVAVVATAQRTNGDVKDSSVAPGGPLGQEPAAH